MDIDYEHLFDLWGDFDDSTAADGMVEGNKHKYRPVSA
jgi:hypothetical protein